MRCCSAHFVEEDGQLSLVEEYVVLGLVGNEGGEVLAHYAVPVRTVLLVELLLDVFGYSVLDLYVLSCVFGLRLWGRYLFDGFCLHIAGVWEVNDGFLAVVGH